MGITRECMSSYKGRKHRLCRRVSKYNYKRWRKHKCHDSININDVLEDKLYELSSNALHLKLYIKKMMYEYIGDTRAEIAVFYAMARNLHADLNRDYCMVMSNTKEAILVDVWKYQQEYEGILDLCGITTDEVYDNMYNDNDDGYETPPRIIEEPADIIEHALENLVI